MELLDIDMVSKEDINKIISFVNENFNINMRSSEKMNGIKNLSIFLKENNIELNGLSASILLEESNILYETLNSVIWILRALKNDNNISMLIDAFDLQKDDVDEEEYLDNENYFSRRNRIYFNASEYYSKEISKISLLTKEEEIELSKRIKNGDKEALDELIIHNLRLVYKLAYKRLNNRRCLDDLVQDGSEGLMIAARKFDCEKGFKFCTYATYWINQKIAKGIDEREGSLKIPSHVQVRLKRYNREKQAYECKYGKSPSRKELMELCEMDAKTLNEIEFIVGNPIVSMSAPIGEEKDSTFEEFMADENNNIEDNIDHIYYDEFIESINKCNLEDRERTVLFMRYGIGYPKAYTLEEVGNFFGVTKERIRQIEDKTIKKLRKDIRNSTRIL